ncbi:MAG TPA: MDR family oxidoreductase [Roseiarcus sp.]|nr:MDR family oxidoreductase [Roseiarcus sp.]
MSFTALRVDKSGEATDVRFVEMRDDELMDGDVTLRVTHSTVNYKDGLVMAGRPGIVQRYPMIAGIDLAGIVESSRNPNFQPGDEALLNGYGLSQTHFGGYAGKARVPGEWLIKLPPGMTRAETMAIGTAGYTAMLCVLALERQGMKPERGPALVTGATGGVGSIAVALLAAAGWQVTASTGRVNEAGYLRDLGATEIIDRSELSAPGKPLGKERWAAAIDSVGSHTLANAIAGLKRGGAAAACGLAQGMDLNMTVAPFILRGVQLIGIDSVWQPMESRLEAWRRLARDLDRKKLAEMTRTIPFERVMEAGADLLAGKVRGRVVVEIG